MFGWISLRDGERLAAEAGDEASRRRRGARRGSSPRRCARARGRSRGRRSTSRRSRAGRRARSGPRACPARAIPGAAGVRPPGRPPAAAVRCGVVVVRRSVGGRRLVGVVVVVVGVVWWSSGVSVVRRLGAGSSTRVAVAACRCGLHEVVGCLDQRRLTVGGDVCRAGRPIGASDALSGRSASAASQSRGGRSGPESLSRALDDRRRRDVLRRWSFRASSPLAARPQRRQRTAVASSSAAQCMRAGRS